MEFTPLCLLLSSLRVSPESSQFFRYSSIMLNCTERRTCSRWTVKRRTTHGGVSLCSSGWGASASRRGCFIRNAYPSDSGAYWCETEDGERSTAVDITVTGGAVILESPVLPVMEGDDVTLCCRTKTPSNLTADFYKDGSLIGTESTGEMIIHSVSRSDEGLYKCNRRGLGESPESWLAVRNGTPPPPPPDPPPPPPPASFLSISRLMCHLVVGTPYLLSTILLGLIYRDRKRAQPEERRGRDDVIMEIAV